MVKPHSSQIWDQVWNSSQQREGSEPALLLEAMLGSLTVPGEPSPAERSKQTELTSVMRLCSSGLTPLYSPSDRADTLFLRSSTEIFSNPGRSFALYTPTMPDELLQIWMAGHLALHYQVIEQKCRIEEEYSFFSFCTMTTSLPSSQLSSLDQSCFK